MPGPERKLPIQRVYIPVEEMLRKLSYMVGRSMEDKYREVKRLLPPEIDDPHLTIKAILWNNFNVEAAVRDILYVHRGNVDRRLVPHRCFMYTRNIISRRRNVG